MKSKLKKNKKIRAYICAFSWIFVLAFMAFVFFLSSQEGTVSEELSQGFLIRISTLIGDTIGHNLLRKTAHAAEYFILSVLVSNAFLLSFSRARPFLSYFVCLAYSITDEIHQYFIPGRACRVFDIFVDSIGSIFGIIVFMLLLFAISKIKGKTKQ
ncbi:MAG TPA: VanZ family protein [Clostridia bacterium]|nr:VanZ family protein [Clostridia bacterium]